MSACRLTSRKLKKTTIAAVSAAILISALVVANINGDDFVPSNLLGIGTDKQNDLYLVDARTSQIYLFDSATGIFLGDFMSAKDVGAESLTDISVCSCGGAITLLDQKGAKVKMIDYTKSALWDKDLKTDEMGNIGDTANAVAICQNSDYEHVIVTSPAKIFHVPPDGSKTTLFSDPKVSFSRPRGAYMDFIKQVFICDTGNARVVKTSEWGDFKKSFGEGVLKKPVDVATSEDNDRRIWVADEETRLVHVFSESMEPIFDCGKGILTKPLSVATDYRDSGCYVAELDVDGKVKVHKFDKDGVHLYTVTDATNLSPQKLLQARTKSYVLFVRNGESLKFTNPIQRVGDSFIAELRSVSSALGFSIFWVPKDRIALVQAPNITLSVDMKTGLMTVKEGGIERMVKVQPSPFISKGRVMVPVTLFEMVFDVSVSTDKDSVTFISPKLQPTQQIPKPDVGKALFEEKCSHCHSLPNPEGKTRDEWPPTVVRMSEKDKQWISSADAEQITRYLWGQGKPAIKP